jgi:hypothetical protein
VSRAPDAEKKKKEKVERSFFCTFKNKLTASSGIQ